MENSTLFIEVVKAILLNERMPFKALKELKRNEEIFSSSLRRNIAEHQFVLYFKRDAILAEEDKSIAKEIGFDTPADEEATIKKVGATIFTGERDFAVPNFGSGNANFVPQTANAPENSDVTAINFEPRRISIYKDLSRNFFMGGSEQMAEFIYRKCLASINKALDAAVFGVQARTSIIPQGLGYKITTGHETKQAAIVPTWDDILDLMDDVGDNDSYNGKLAFVTSVNGARILSSIYKDTGQTKFILEDGKISGYPCFICNQVSDEAGSDEIGSLLVFGAWQDFAIRDYGLMVTVDKVTLALYNKVRLNLSWFVDYRGLNGEEDTGENTDKYEFANSFSSIAIKAAS